MDDDTKEVIKALIRFLLPILLIGGALAVFSAKLLLTFF